MFRDIPLISTLDEDNVIDDDVAARAIRYDKKRLTGVTEKFGRICAEFVLPTCVTEYATGHDRPS